MSHATEQPHEASQPGSEVPSKPLDGPDEEQADDDPRGRDEIRRELGAGDGDDPPPVTGDEPPPR